MAESAIFDGVADRYDADFSDTYTGKLQRERVHLFLKDLLAEKSLNILELNCGTGVDAVWLAKMGHTVLATDLSGGMVAQTLARADREGVMDRVKAQKLGFGEIAAVQGHGPFDMVFSNFGGLNCLDAAGLRQLAMDLGKLVKPGGLFVSVVMPRGCLWERLYFLAKFQWGKAFRRRSKGPVIAPLQDGSFQPTWYYRPKEFAAAFSGDFDLEKQLPVGIALPPSYLDPLVAKRPRLLARLVRWEKRLAKPWMANAGDHCLMVLKKM